MGKGQQSVPVFLFGDEELGDGQAVIYCVWVNFVVVMGTRCFANPTFAQRLAVGYKRVNLEVKEQVEASE